MAIFLIFFPLVYSMELINFSEMTVEEKIGQLLFVKPVGLNKNYLEELHIGGIFLNEQKTKEVLTEDGWFKTGDLGVLDKNQVLTHKGRLKNVIIGANGENIYPEEIEALINNYGHVLESLVIEKKGKLLALVRFNVEGLEEKYADLKHDIEEKILELSNDLQHYLNQKLNKISRVQSIIIQKDPFKRTATQKIKRYLYI